MNTLEERRLEAIEQMNEHQREMRARALMGWYLYALAAALVSIAMSFASVGWGIAFAGLFVLVAAIINLVIAYND